MSRGVVIDHQLNGWAKRNEERIRRDYSEIHYLGEASNPSIASTDAELASFCRKNGYDLLTCDKAAHIPHLHGPDVKEVIISKYGLSNLSGQLIFAIRAV